MEIWRTKKLPIAGLPTKKECGIDQFLLNREYFTKTEVAEMLGINLYQVSYDSLMLWGEDVKYKPLNRQQAFTIYAVACYRMFQEHIRGSELNPRRVLVREFEIISFLERSEEEIFNVIEAVGGSKEDFNKRVEKVVFDRSIKKVTEEK